MTIPSTVSASPYGTPYPDSRLTDEERLARYVRILDAAAQRQRAYRASKAAIASFQTEALHGHAMKLIHLNEGFGA